MYVCFVYCLIINNFLFYLLSIGWKFYTVIPKRHTRELIRRGYFKRPRFSGLELRIHWGAYILSCLNLIFYKPVKRNSFHYLKWTLRALEENYHFKNYVTTDTSSIYKICSRYTSPTAYNCLKRESSNTYLHVRSDNFVFFTKFLTTYLLRNVRFYSTLRMVLGFSYFWPPSY